MQHSSSSHPCVVAGTGTVPTQNRARPTTSADAAADSGRQAAHDARATSRTAAGSSPSGAATSVVATSATDAPEELEARVRGAVVGLGGSATDVSAQRIALRLRGTRVRDVLAKGCSIDLHPRVFGRGSSAQSTIGLAGVVLLALSDGGDDYVVLVRSSFAGHLADWLLDAALEFTAQHR